MLKLCQDQHRREVLEQEDDSTICARRYMSNCGYELKCNGNFGFGNTATEWLNHFATAVVLNRTVVLGPGGLEPECDEFISVRRWLPDFEFVSRRLSAAKCSEGFGQRHSSAIST